MLQSLCVLYIDLTLLINNTHCQDERLFSTLTRVKNHLPQQNGSAEIITESINSDVLGIGVKRFNVFFKIVVTFSRFNVFFYFLDVF